MELLPLATEGGGYLLPKVKLKYWPLVHNLQPLVFAGIELREQLNGREPIELQIATCANAKRESGSEPAKWDPRTRETADHRAPYILSLTYCATGRSTTTRSSPRPIWTSRCGR